jgi:sporulation protein YqfC
MPKHDKTKKPTLLERAADLMDLPADTVAGMPRIEIIGCRQFFLSNHKGVMEYEADCIAINGGRVIVRVRGEGMEIKSMSAGDMLIEGTIFGIEFAY